MNNGHMTFGEMSELDRLRKVHHKRLTNFLYKNETLSMPDTSQYDDILDVSTEYLNDDEYIAKRNRLNSLADLYPPSSTWYPRRTNAEQEEVENLLTYFSDIKNNKTNIKFKTGDLAVGMFGAFACKTVNVVMTYSDGTMLINDYDEFLGETSHFVSQSDFEKIETKITVTEVKENIESTPKPKNPDLKQIGSNERYVEKYTTVEAIELIMENDIRVFKSTDEEKEVLLGLGKYEGEDAIYIRYEGEEQKPLLTNKQTLDLKWEVVIDCG